VGIKKTKHPRRKPTPRLYGVTTTKLIIELLDLYSKLP